MSQLAGTILLRSVVMEHQQRRLFSADLHNKIVVAHETVDLARPLFLLKKKKSVVGFVFIQKCTRSLASAGWDGTEQLLGSEAKRCLMSKEPSSSSGQTASLL